MNILLNSASEKIIIRIGVFFDGSGKNGNVFDGTPEEMFRVTNIYRLFKHYISQNSEQGGIRTGKVYIEGIGTLNNEPDSIYSLVTGDEENCGCEGYGPDSKLKICHERIMSELDRILMSEEASCPKSVSVEFDVFGFSRGAVLARHFINLVYEKNAVLLDQISSALNKHDHALADEPVINFLGLFDTVGTFMDSTVFDKDPHDSGYTRNLYVKVPAGAVRNAFQLNAMHEYRYNFPLHSLYGLYPELTIAGAHTDVGGSYPDMIDEVKDLTGYTYGLPLYRAATRAEKELSPLLKRNQWAFLSKKISYEGSLRFRCKAMSHRRVKGHLQFVALLTMARIAERCGCIFAPDIKTYEDMIPCELLAYYNHVRQRADEALEGKPEGLDPEFVQKVIPAYVHLSASCFTVSELFGEMRQNRQLMMCRGDVQDSQQKVINISVINNFWPHRPDTNWERKVFK